MTNGRGQVATIRENIFRKYGRYQVHPKKVDDPDEPPSLREQILQYAAKQQALDELPPQQAKAAAIADVLQDIHDRNNK